MDEYGRIIEFLPNLRDFPISRDVGLGVGKKPITCSSVVVNFLKIKNFSKNRLLIAAKLSLMHGAIS